MRLVLVAVLGLGLFVGCPAKDPAATGPRVLGTDGRERYVVVFDATAPDLADYRALLKDKPDDAEAYAEKMRAKLHQDHADFEASLSTVNGRVVERWWMSNALTVEVEATGVPTLQKAPGVKSVTPDALLGE